MDDRHELLLAEYKEVFAEVRQAIALQYSALGVGLALIAFVGKEAGAAKNSNQELCAILLLTVPFWVLFSLYTWAGEVACMRRGSVYLSHIEESLSVLFTRDDTAKETFGFQSWLLSSKGKPQLTEILHKSLKNYV